MSDERTNARSKAAGAERFARDEIPSEVAEAVSRKLVAGAALHPARDGGAYKGPVIYVDRDFIAQELGTSKQSAVLHRRAEVEMVDANLKWRAENNRLGSTPVQIHYHEGQGKAYRWNQEREQADQLLAKAKEFAKTIADPREAEAFLKHTGQMLRGAAERPRQAEGDKARSAPASREISGIER